MNERNNNSFSGKVVDLKSRGGLERSPHSQFGHFAADEELLQSTARIKSQRDVILDRVQKMNNASEKVSKTVYEKVRRDYSLQLETINELLNEKKHQLKEEIKKLYVCREKLSFEINRHREILEEAEFRHFLGEFTQSQYQEVENYETKEIEKLEGDLSHIAHWIRTHEELFDPDDFGQKRPEKKSSLRQDEVTKSVMQPTPQAKESRWAAPEQQTPTRQSAPQQQATQQAVTVAPQTQAQRSEPVAKQNLTQAAPTSEDSIPSLDDFSYLFDDEAKDGDNAESYNNTEGNIRELLEQEQAEQAAQEAEKSSAPEAISAAATSTISASDSTEDDLLIPEPEDQDYFKQDHVNEASFSVPRDEESITAAKKVSSTDSERHILTPNQEQPVNREDSISNILDSIRLDDEVQEGTPAAAADADVSASVQTDFKLVMTQGDLDSRIFAVRDNTSIGRSPSNDVVLKEPKVSRQHAAINKYNDHYIMIDLKSSNGVYVNGAKVDECVLHPGDEISIGGYKFVFQKN